MLAAALLCLLGLALLVVGAEILVRASVRFAALLGIAPVVVGLTVVALGTSAPELAVGIEAALRGNGALAIGNIAGTNIVNILLILGLSAALVALPIERRTIRIDLPAMVVSAVAMWLMARDGHLSRVEGVALVLGAVAYTGIVLRGARERDENGAAVERPAAGWGRLALTFAVLVAGMAIVVHGANQLVTGATDLARLFGVSDAFIGLTIVAIGTSAPELVTTLVSTIRGNRDVAIGNLIGSSAYNILMILGLTIAVTPGGIEVPPLLVRVDIPVMAGVALLCIPIFRSHHRISRAEGAAFVAAYAVYLAYLVIART